MSVQRLKYIQALGRHRNFKHASAELGISQPALSKAVKQLEDQYGVLLFERSTRQVKPTEFGLILINYADKIVPQYQEIEREIDLLKGFEKGKLVIGCDAYFAETVVAEVMTIMLQEHPRLRYKIVTGQKSDLLEQLINKHIDIVVGAPSAELLPNIAYRMYKSFQMHMFGRADHPLFNNEVPKILDCLDYPIVGVDTPQHLKDWIVEATGISHEDEFIKQPVLALCDNFGLIKKLVETTDSISAAPKKLLDEILSSGKFKEIKSDAGLMPRSEFGVAILKGRLIPPAVDRFMELFDQAMNNKN